MIQWSIDKEDDMPDFIPLGQCECGCGEPVTNSKITRYKNLIVEGYPIRFILAHSNNVRKPESGICSCGCGTKIEENEFFVPDHGTKREQHLLLTRHACPNCRQVKKNREFPPTRPGFDFVCKDCQDTYRKEQLVRVIKQKKGIDQLCKCGCGWPTDLSPFNSKKLGLRVGDPIPYIVSHSREKEIRYPVYAANPPQWVDRGYETPCLERFPDENKSGIIVFIPERPGPINSADRGMRYPRVEVLAWEAVHGLIARGQHIEHRCDNDSCENITHLYCRNLSPISTDRPEQPANYGYCHCGCGKKTSIANKTIKSRGWVKGQPVPFATGHSGKHLTGNELEQFMSEMMAAEEEERNKIEVCSVCHKDRYTLYDYLMDDPEGVCKYCAAEQRMEERTANSGMDLLNGINPKYGIREAVINNNRIVPDKETALEYIQYGMMGHNTGDYIIEGSYSRPMTARTEEEMMQMQEKSRAGMKRDSPFVYGRKVGILSYPMPFGVCRCGCGEFTAVATFDDPTRGYIKGMPFPFKKRHRRKSLPFIIEHPHKLRTDRTKECDSCLRELWLTDFNDDITRDNCNSCDGIRPVSAAISVLQEVS